MSAKAYWLAFGIGVTAGAAVALLYAPQSGARTRKNLGKAYNEATDYLEDAGDYLKDQAERLGQRSQKLYAQGKDAATDAYASAAASAEDAYHSTSDRLADAFSDAKSKADAYADLASGYGKKVRSMV